VSFARLPSLADAIVWIDREIVSSLGAERVPLAELSGRVLAQDLAAASDTPPFDRAVADGYAVSAQDTFGASVYSPLTFRLAEASAADLATGLAIATQVASGSPIPRGADAVVLPDHVQHDPGAATVEIIEPAIAGANVDQRGDDFSRGTPLLRAGRRIRPADVGLLGVAGIGFVEVVRRPRVRLVVTGADLYQVGQELPCGGVYDADTAMLRALVERDGGTTEIRRVEHRVSNAIREAIVGPAADLVIVVGGSGVGAEDVPVLRALRELRPGDDAGGLAIHGIALRPGMSTGMGRVGSTPVFLLPGAPVSCLWAYELIASRGVRRLAGRCPELPYLSRDFMTVRKIVSSIGFVEVCAVRRMPEPDNVEPSTAAPPDRAGSLLATAQADGFVLIPEASEGFPPGTRVRVYLYEDANSCRDPNYL
jgi:molybdopterin molybdotransferase